MPPVSQVARAAPFVEKLVAKGLEVLYLTDAIDEATITNLQKFGDKELVDVSKEGLNVSGGAKLLYFWWKGKAHTQMAAIGLTGRAWLKAQRGMHEVGEGPGRL